MGVAAEAPVSTGVNGKARLRAVRARRRSISQSGATLFSELVWAHDRWREHRDGGDAHDEASSEALQRLDAAYRHKLEEFEQAEGPLEQVYWSTRDASAVAMTVTRGRYGPVQRLLFRDRDDTIRLHRLTDWVTRENPAIADLLHECDVLAIKVNEILLGTSQRVAMRSILGIEAHLVGAIERHGGPLETEAEAGLVDAQRERLAEVEAYYHRAAAKSGRIAFVAGMLMGTVIVGLLGLITGVLLNAAGISTSELEILTLCFSAGAVGALVSAMQRMGRSERGSVTEDFELGRPLLRRLGVYRPFVGAVFGVVLYFVLKSGVVDVTAAANDDPYYYGFAAFLAGFSERFATVLFGTAEDQLVQRGPGHTSQGGQGDARE